MLESPEDLTPPRILMTAALYALQSDLKETALKLIDDARGELHEEIARDAKGKRRRIPQPSVEDLMEAPIHSVLQHHPIHGRLVKTSSHLWRVEGPTSYVDSAHHYYYYYAEEIAELQSMTLIYPESEEA